MVRFGSEQKDGDFLTLIVDSSVFIWYKGSSSAKEDVFHIWIWTNVVMNQHRVKEPQAQQEEGREEGVAVVLYDREKRGLQACASQQEGRESEIGAKLLQEGCGSE